MLNDTIPNQGWQLDSHTYGRCSITTQALASMVLAYAASFREITGVGAHALPLTHPDAWRTISIVRIDAITIPVTMHADAIHADVIARIQTQLAQQLSRWVGMPVAITVAVVNATPPQRKGIHRGAH